MGLWRQMLWVWQGYGQWCGEGYETLPWVADEAQLFPKATWGIKDMEHWGRSASYSCGVDYCRPHSGHKVLTFVDTPYLDTLRYQAFQIPDAYGWCVWIVNFFFFFWGCLAGIMGLPLNTWWNGRILDMMKLHGKSKMMWLRFRLKSQNSNLSWLVPRSEKVRHLTTRSWNDSGRISNHLRTHPSS